MAAASPPGCEMRTSGEAAAGHELGPRGEPRAVSTAPHCSRSASGAFAACEPPPSPPGAPASRGVADYIRAKYQQKLKSLETEVATLRQQVSTRSPARSTSRTVAS